MTVNRTGQSTTLTISDLVFDLPVGCVAQVPAQCIPLVFSSPYDPAMLLQPPKMLSCAVSQTDGFTSQSLAPWTSSNQTSLAPSMDSYVRHSNFPSLPYPMIPTNAVAEPGWGRAVQVVSHDPLPKLGAPARPCAQRLHANRVHPFPPRNQSHPVRIANQERQRALRNHSYGVALQQLAPEPCQPTLVSPYGVARTLHLSAPHETLPLQGIGNLSSLVTVNVPRCYPFYVSSTGPVAPPVLNSNPRQYIEQLHHAGVTFSILHGLGEGSAGRVVLGENRRQLYAIKAIHPRRAKRAYSLRDNFLREKEFMIKIAKSKSRFLVPLLMSWEEDGRNNEGRIFFVMPSCPVDMHVALKTCQPMSLKDRYLYCQELICALCTLRDLGIVHRDIKPGNILINFQGRAVLTDFGMAQAVPTAEYETWRRDAYSGTYAYMAPEMVNGKRYGSVVDVWSMGLVFLEILRFAGHRYFTAESLQEARQEHAQKLPIRFEVPLGFDPAFANIVASMLHTDPDKRMTSRELQNRYVSSCSWASVLEGKAVHDWIPSVGLLHKPHPRYLEFLTFRASEGAHRKSDNLGTDTSEFDYRAEGVFV